MVAETKTTTSSILLSLEGITKQYPNGTIGLRDVHMDVAQATVHGLVGANGAGKSTLFKVISGVHPASGGSMKWKGTPVHWSTPADARAAGIVTMYQHIPLVPTLSVLENIFLADMAGLYKRGWWLTQLDDLAERIGYGYAADELVGNLSIGQRQMVAVAQALASGAELICMDEPTASLADAEKEILFSAIRRLRASSQVSFVFCSHFLDNVLDISDSVTVVRDGRTVASKSTSEISENELVELIVGKKLAHADQQRSLPIDEKIGVSLSVQNLTSTHIRNLNLEIKQGEIVGLAGLMGSGRSAILRAIFGSDHRVTGEIILNGKSVPRTPAAAVKAGIAFVPEDRAKQGLHPDWEIWRNITLPHLTDVSWRHAVPIHQEERKQAERAVADLNIVATSVDMPVGLLSGGNAQKVVFGKWVHTGATLFLLDEPTAGVDVGAKAEILEFIRAFARDGGSVIVVDSELDELTSIAHRILVVCDGEIIAERAACDTSEVELVVLVSGLHKAAKVEMG